MNIRLKARGSVSVPLVGRRTHDFLAIAEVELQVGNVGGSGMVHPNVLREVGYDPDVYTGWAFGFGIERIGLARYEIDDIRRFVESDPDFLAQLA